MKTLRLLILCLTMVLAACAQPGQPEPGAPDGGPGNDSTNGPGNDNRNDNGTGNGPDDGNDNRAIEIQALPAYLTFAGTSSASVELRASGPWTAETDQSWLTITPASGTGDSEVTITVDRADLQPDHYAGSVLFKGGSSREVVTIAMRFPNVTGSLTDPSNQVTATSAATSPIDLAALPHVPGEVIVQLDRHMTAIDLLQNSAADSDFRVLSGAELTAAAASLAPHELQSAAARLADDYGLGATEHLAPGSSVFVVKGDADVSTMIKQLSRDGRAALVQPNLLHSHFAEPDDKWFGEQWHYRNINLPAAWDLTTGSPEIVIAVIDDAVDVSHPDLAGRLVPGYDFNTNSVSILSRAADHGTHVAGIIAAASNNGIGVAGVNWDARVMPLNVFDHNDSAAITDVYRAIVFAAGMCINNSAGVQVCNDSPVDVINLSLGVDNPRCLTMPTDSILTEAVAFAIGQGVTIIAAAGNDGCRVVSIPASIPGVLAVSATNINDVKATYSNSGQEIWVSAPGGDSLAMVLSTVSGGRYAYAAGTSMASPHVAGVAALIKAANPELTPTEVAFILRETATDLGLEGRDTWYGYGLINAEAAVALARKTLRADYPDFIIRVMSGDTLIQQTRAGTTGEFSFSNLAEGTYTLEAGNDRNGNTVLGDAGEFYGTANLEVRYDGDTTGISVPVEPQ